MDLVSFAGVSILLFPNLLKKRSFFYLIFYGLLTFIYHLLGNVFFGSIEVVIIPFLSMFVSLYIFEYSLMYDYDYKYTKWVIYLVVGLNVVMALISIPQLRINPNIIRLMDSVNMRNTDFVASNYRLLVTYATLHGLPLLMAPMAFLIRKLFSTNKTICYFWLFSIVVFYVLLAMGNAATAFLIASLSIAISIFFYMEKFTRKNIVKLVFFAILGLFLAKPSVLIPVADFAQSFMPDNGATYSRIEELKVSMIYGEAEGDLEARQELYGNSQALFWESPLIGTQTPEKISRHTWIWDRLACFGIILITPLILLLFIHFKRAYQSLAHTKVTYSISIVLLMILLYYKNDFEIGTWLYAFTALPMLCRYIDYIIDRPKDKKSLFK